MNKLLIGFLVLMGVVIGIGNTTVQGRSKMSSLPKNNNPVVEMDIEIKSEKAPVKGSLVIELYKEKAPITVKNFLSYVKDDSYDGTDFHRVIDGFMIQGGGYDADMKERATREPIKNEADNGLKNEVGTIAMARTQVVDSATAQFFINVGDNDFLNFRSKTDQGYGYAVFGKVIKGMDLVEKIKASKTHRVSYFDDVPVEAVVITKATVLRD